MVLRLKILHFTGDATGERFGIKECNGIDATPSTAGGLPKRAHTDTVGTDYTQPRNDNPATVRVTIVGAHIDSLELILTLWTGNSSIPSITPGISSVKMRL